MRDSVIIAGAGGQGIIALGRIIAQIALEDGLFVTLMPSYGAEVRGGAASCHVIVSTSEIASPVIDSPSTLIILNEPSYTRFKRHMGRCRRVIVNSTFISVMNDERAGRRVIACPATDIARSLGSIKCANLAMLGSYAAAARLFRAATVERVVYDFFREKSEPVRRMNLAALKRGAEGVS